MTALQRHFPNNWLTVMLYVPHGLYMAGFGLLTIWGFPKSATITYLSNQWGVPSEAVGLLFAMAGAGVLIVRNQLTVFFAYFVQFCYFLSLVWVVTYNKLTASAIFQNAIILASLIIMLHFATYLERSDGAKRATIERS